MLQGNICMFGNSKKFELLHFDFRRRKIHVTGRRLHYLTRTGMVKSPVRSLPRLNSPQDTNTDLVSYLWVSMFSGVCKKRSGMYVHVVINFIASIWPQICIYLHKYLTINMHISAQSEKIENRWCGCMGSMAALLRYRTWSGELIVWKKVNYTGYFYLTQVSLVRFMGRVVTSEWVRDLVET